MQRVLLVSVLFPCLLLGLVFASNHADTSVPALTLVPDSSAQVRQGAELYDFNCSVCHGDTALGFEEAKLAFPEDHRRCERCHRPKNPPQMSLNQMEHNFAFSVGTPPALAGETTLQNFPHGLALYHYLQATMPRPFPGALTDGEYLAITAFLLEANGVSLGDADLDLRNAASFLLHDR
jgi:hypothetical protein